MNKLNNESATHARLNNQCAALTIGDIHEK